MIYEAAVLARADLGDEKLATIKAIVSNLVQEAQGEILIQEDWGVKAFAQPLARGKTRGHYLYYMYRAGSGANAELDRRLGISEDVIRSMIIQMGPDEKQAQFVKGHKNPFIRQ